jgi:hypothetical protein
MTLVEDLQTVKKTCADQAVVIDDLKTRLAVAERDCSEIKSLRKAAYWVCGLIVAGAIGFGFSVLTLIPHV